MDLECKQEWGSASAIMKAFKVGKFESAAIANLQENMPQPVSEALKEAVRVRGMKQFVLHETIAKEIFNSAWTSGTGTLEQWSSQLTNSESNELVFGKHRIFLLLNKIISSPFRVQTAACF